MILSRIKIGIRLGIGFGIMTLFVAIMTFVGTRYMDSIALQTTKLYNHPYTVSTALLRIDLNIVKIHRAMKDVALARNVSEINIAVETVDEFEKLVYRDFDIIEKAFLGDQSDIEHARGLFSSWKSIRDEVIELMKSDNREEAALITKEKGADHVGKINGALEGLIQFAENKASEFVQSSTGYEKQAKVITYILLIIIITFAVVIAYLITSSILKQLGVEPIEIARISKSIGEGNLLVEFDESKKLVGVNYTLHMMVQKLQSVVKGVLMGAEEIALASNDISQGNKKLSVRTEAQASALEETSASIEQMNSSIRSNAENTKVADELSQSALDKTKDGTDAVELMISSMNEINESSSRIADIIEVINNIAFQTNLLALNASIEAARAGEQGKGFAVVAVEVRKLAKRSDSAASEITDIIKNSTKKVEGGVIVANDTSEVLNEISEAVKEVSKLVSEISTSSQEQLTTANQIEHTISSLDEMTQKNAGMVEQSVSSTDELSVQASQLSDNIKFFNV